MDFEDPDDTVEASAHGAPIDYGDAPTPCESQWSSENEEEEGDPRCDAAADMPAAGLCAMCRESNETSSTPSAECRASS